MIKEDVWLEEVVAKCITLDTFFGEMPREEILRWAAAQELAFVTRAVVFYLGIKDVVIGKMKPPAELLDEGFVKMDLKVSLEEMLEEIREAGWMVAVHNDYRKDIDLQRTGTVAIHGTDEAIHNLALETNQVFTFWLFTHPNGTYLKGEGKTDREALGECLKKMEEFPAGDE